MRIMNYVRKILLVASSLFAVAAMVFPATRQSENVSYKEEDSAAVAVSAKGSETESASDLKVSSRLWELLFGESEEDEEKVILIPGGSVFGARVKQNSVTISDPCDINGLKSGDTLLSIDGKKVSSVSDVKAILSSCRGKTLTLVCKRDSSKIEAKVTPKLIGNEYRLGIQLKDGAAGIGTITYIDPQTGLFGGLGHGICDSESGEVIEIVSGNVTGVILGGVQKGEAGKPGELCGILTDKNIGTVYANTPCGIFGKLDTVPNQDSTVAVAVGDREDVHTGKATIFSTVKNGKMMEYDIEITEVDTDSHGTKSFKIKVTDPALIAITGGIVRGMSGSPIIQDGKLVGAVTHVMVANPTEGYGIFIENMLNAAQGETIPKVA